MMMTKNVMSIDNNNNDDDDDDVNEWRLDR